MAGTVLLAYYFECTNIFSIHIQGFFCNDAELMKPYPGVEENSFIPPLILYCVVAAAPTTVVSKILLLKLNAWGGESETSVGFSGKVSCMCYRISSQEGAQ